MDFISNFLVAPVEIIACIVLIFMQVSWAVFVGVALMIAVMPLSRKVFILNNKLLREKMKVRSTL